MLAPSPASAVRSPRGSSRSRDDELLTISFFGFAVLIAGVAEVLGVSDAIGAFMAGLVLAGTAIARRVERLAIPHPRHLRGRLLLRLRAGIRPADLVDLAGPVAIAVTITVVIAVVAGLVAPGSTTSTAMPRPTWPRPSWPAASSP